MLTPPSIPLLDLTAQYQTIKPEIDRAVRRVIESGRFILGAEVAALEEEVAAYSGVRHAVGVASGTDALILALRALQIGPGDEVILPAYTFFATAGAVLNVGATPLLVDIDPHTYCLDIHQVETRITPKTKAVIPVHLYGHPADMDPLLELAQAHGLKVIEDNAQALGAAYQGQKTGGFGHIACLSFFPSKNLGAYGDGGMLLTSDPALVETVRMLRAHGWKQKYFPEILGYNSRLDSLQAAILRAKLPHLDDWNDRRRQLARRYNQALAGLPGLTGPYEAPGAQHVYHLYILRLSERDRIQKELKAAGIASAVYYPQPLHLSKPLSALGYKPGDFPISEQASRETLAIPIFPELSDGQVQHILTTLKSSLA
ncbi:DegT/DnrJ/EryC1/StrS family aminotransferase [Chloroflexota bacterium]